MSATETLGEYFTVERDGEHVVLYRDEKTPEWWRVIARFTIKNRAEVYAFIENDVSKDEGIPEDMKRPPPKTPEPPSAIRPERLIASPPGPELDVKEMASDIVQSAAAQASGGIDPKTKEPAAESLDPRPKRTNRTGVPIHTRSEQLYGWLREWSRSSNVMPTFKEMHEGSGVPKGSIGGTLDDLEIHKKLIAVERDENGHRSAIRLIDEGISLKGTIANTPRAPRNSKPEIQPCKPFRRFTGKPNLNPENVTPLPDGHPALKEKRTLFPSTVIDAVDSPRLLVSGGNQKKLGDKVVKGPWKGMPIYCLTLEERATCPETCHHWSTCYGNGMQWARRHKHGAAFEKRLWEEVALKAEYHPDGFVIRLHILGDFYNKPYAETWAGRLSKHPELHIFGYTAHPRDSAIGGVIDKYLNGFYPERCAIRFSVPESDGGNEAIALWETPEPGQTHMNGALICPAQTKATDCCGTCGLCWSPAMKETPIGFVTHGRVGKSPAARKTTIPRESPFKHAALTDPLESAIEWLEGKGRDVETLGPATFVVDGATMTIRQLMAAANNERIRANRAPFPVPALDPPSGGGSSLKQAVESGIA